MAICEKCKKFFNYNFEKDSFEIEMPSKNYDNLKISLCAKCAVNAIESREDGIYFEVCEKCGKTFDFAVDEGRFLSYHSDDCGADFEMFGILCVDCANEAYDELPILDDIEDE